MPEPKLKWHKEHQDTYYADNGVFELAIGQGWGGHYQCRIWEMEHGHIIITFHTGCKTVELAQLAAETAADKLANGDCEELRGEDG